MACRVVSCRVVAWRGVAWRGVAWRWEVGPKMVGKLEVGLNNRWEVDYKKYIYRRWEVGFQSSWGMGG